MRKVLFIYFRYPLYPAGSYFQEFLNTLAASVERAYLIATRFPMASFKQPTNLSIVWVPCLKMRFVEDVCFAFAALLAVMFAKDVHKVDLTNTIGPRGLLAGWYLKRRYGIPLVCTIEMLNEKGSFLNNSYYALVRFLMTKIPIDEFICWSDYYWENHLKQWRIPKEKVVIIPGGVDTKVYNPAVHGTHIREKYAGGFPLVVFAKPLYYQNTEAAKILVSSVALLKKTTRVKLLIGDGEGKTEIQNLCRKLAVEDSVEFMPVVPFPEIPEYLAAADLIVLPFSYAATTSRSLFEAMAMGKPIVTTSVGEIPRVIKNGYEALLVNPIAEDVALAMQRILADPDLAKSLGRNAAALINREYALPLIVNKTLDAYEQALQSKRERPIS